LGRPGKHINSLLLSSASLLRLFLIYEQVLMFFSYYSSKCKCVAFCVSFAMFKLRV
jgi:hypothetical protein